MRRFHPPEPSPVVKRWCWLGLLVVSVVVVPLCLWWGDSWNQATRELMGMAGLEPWNWPAIVVLALLVSGLILVVARSIRLATRLVIRLIERWIPRRWSVGIGVAIVVIALVGFVDGVLFRAFHESLNAAYSVADKDTTPGFVQPESPLRSGSVESLVEWDDLGNKGRDFTGEGGGEEKMAGPAGAAIGEFNGESALDPIRAYVGLRSADTLEERVDLAIAELERTDAFDRQILAVYATTGTGWIDERVADSLEYIWGGDTAAVGMQYSYLPSWVSFLVDLDKASDTGAALIDAVVERVEQMPEAERPELYVFGESLGSYATEAAFEDLDDMVAKVDGAMLVGPTFNNDLRNQFLDERDEGSPAWRPIFEDAQTVRFTVDPSDLDSAPGPWDDPHVVYLQNSSDPISFFSPDLLWSEPDWLDEPRADDANPDMFWFPLVTFWQVAADLTYSFSAPAGHGHRYGANVVDGWLAISTPEGWSEDDTARLRDIVGHE